MKKKLDAVPYQEPLWAGRYPKLVNILNEEPDGAQRQPHCP